MQSTNTAFGKVAEETVYPCAGHLLKSDLTDTLAGVSNQDLPTAYRNVTEVKTLTALALHDILTETCLCRLSIFSLNTFIDQNSRN